MVDQYTSLQVRRGEERENVLFCWKSANSLLIGREYIDVCIHFFAVTYSIFL